MALEESLRGIMRFRRMTLFLAQFRGSDSCVLANRTRNHLDLDGHDGQHLLLQSFLLLELGEVCSFLLVLLLRTNFLQ